VAELAASLALERGRGAEFRQCSGHDDTPVLLLPVLEQSEQHASDGGGAVQGVNRFRAPLAAIANLEASSLEIGRVRAGGDLAVAALARQPDLEVDLLGGRRAEVAGGMFTAR